MLSHDMAAMLHARLGRGRKWLPLLPAAEAANAGRPGHRDLGVRLPATGFLDTGHIQQARPGAVAQRYRELFTPNLASSRFGLGLSGEAAAGGRGESSPVAVV